MAHNDGRMWAAHHDLNGSDSYLYIDICSTCNSPRCPASKVNTFYRHNLLREQDRPSIAQKVLDIAELIWTGLIGTKKVIWMCVSRLGYMMLMGPEIPLYARMADAGESEALRDAKARKKSAGQTIIEEQIFGGVDGGQDAARDYENPGAASL